MMKQKPILAVALVVLFTGTILAAVTGAWLPLLRAAGIIAPPQVEVNFINVGDARPGVEGVVGDSILLTSSEGKRVLIDGGYPNGKALEFLVSRNIDHLDLVVLTHPHDDHAGGLVEVLQAIPVDLLVHNGQAFESPVYESLQKVIQTKAIKTRVVKSGETLNFGSLTFDVLSPRRIIPDSINNGSVVLRLDVGRVSFLFTGDIMRLEEERLLAVKAPIDVDILKIGHHGSETSSYMPFIEQVSPSVAIYSSGEDVHDYPNPITLENLTSLGAEIYGTNVNGTITVITDGKTYEVLPEYGED